MMNIMDFVPHRWCMSNQPLLLTLFFAADMTVAFCFIVLTGVLLAFAWAKRGEFIAKFHALFSLFVFSCGLSHAMQAITLYYPLYWLEVTVISVTALFAVASVVAVLKNYIRLRDLPRRSTLEKNLIEQKNIVRAGQVKFKEKLSQIKYYRDLHSMRKTAH